MISYNTTTPKYKNTKTEIDGIIFDSKREARRYQELVLMVRDGLVSSLELQPAYELVPSFKRNGKTVRAINYIADFRYLEAGKTVVEDLKGFRTPVFRLKEKMFWFRYPDIELRITK